jgi:hypothetical protein
MNFKNYLPRYNVVWNTPSRDSMDSMPLSGRHGAGANVWVQDGSIWLYLAHNCAYDENGRLLKLGCVRITPSGQILQGFSSFFQELDLASGEIRIRIDSHGEESFTASLWFAGETLIIQTSTSTGRTLEISFATWRDRDREKLHLEVPVEGWDFAEHTVRRDRVECTPQGIMWSHRNADHFSRLDAELELQPWAVESLHNPASRLVFGGALACSSPLESNGGESVFWQNWSGYAWRCQAISAKTHVVSIALRAEREGSPAVWLSAARELLLPSALSAARAAEQTRWDEFWSRSHIVINPDASTEDSGWQVGRNYQLFRYMLACNRGGALPLLFNGGIFTVDAHPGRIKEHKGENLIEPAGPSTPDFRRWLFCHFMSQNQRWLGWPCIAAGDWDLVEPSVAFYRDRAPTAAARAACLGAPGVVFPEPIELWGLSWNARPDGLCKAEHLELDFSMMLEFAWMALTAHSVLGTDLRSDLTWIIGTLRFYDSFYRKQTRERTGSELSADGRLTIYPANSIEFAAGAKNPVEVIAGLRRISEALLSLVPGMLSPDERDFVAQLQAAIPDLPVDTETSDPVLLPAASFEKTFNLWELPELYAAWPYRVVGVLHPETIRIARSTWENLPSERAEYCRQDLSWMPVVANMAALGLADEAKQRIVAKLSDARTQVRFPAFFGPGHDWLPDHNWGGAAMVGLQEMLVAADPVDLQLVRFLPAWPEDWDVDFKLHAPGQKIVEGAFVNGKLTVEQSEAASRPNQSSHLRATVQRAQNVDVGFL